jgi:outer membrane protein TolC
LLVGAALLLATGCIADRNDALAMRDEALFDNLMEGELPGERSEEERREMGRRLNEWATDFEGAEEITLADCFRLVLNNSEELLMQGEKLLQMWTHEREAIASLLPKASFIWSHSIDEEAVKFGGMEVSPRKSTSYWLSFQQKLFDGRSLAAVPAARESKRIEQLNLRDRRDRLLYGAAAGFFMVLGLERDINVLEKTLASATEFHRVLEARRRSGEASMQETLSALAQKEQAQSQLIQARHDRLIARSDLQRMLGLSSLPEHLKDTFQVQTGPGSVPVLVESAVKNRADLESARAAVEFAKAERLAALADYFPLVTADFTRYLKREGAFSDRVDWNLSFNVSWDLFDSGGREARQARALSQIRQQELAVKSLERKVRYEVEEAVLSFHSLDRMMSALESRAHASKSALDLANKEYEANEATNLDVEIARRVWAESERDLIRARLALKLAALKIRLVIGDFKVDKPLVEE